MRSPLPQRKEGRVLADWIVASLREAILQGYFESGEKLDQGRIAEDLEVSRTPVREALKQLEAEGFIEIRSHRGAYITKVTPEDVHDVFEIRQIIESEVIRQVTPVIPEKVLDELEEKARMEAIIDSAAEPIKHYEFDTYFHDSILGFTKNKLFKETLITLNNRIIRVRYFALVQPGSHLTLSEDEHIKIVNAMRTRDPEAASNAMKLHLQNSAKRIQEFLV